MIDIIIMCSIFLVVGIGIIWMLDPGDVGPPLPPPLGYEKRKEKQSRCPCCGCDLDIVAR